jgi:hypothetical protein
LVAGWLCPLASAGEKEEKIRLATQGNTNALERLSQVSFLATVEEGKGLGEKGYTYTVRYWRSGEKWRMNLKGKRLTPAPDTRGDIDICSNGSESRSVTRRPQGGKTTCVLSRPRPIPKPTTYDVWGEGLLSVHNKDTLTFGELLAQCEVTKAEVEGQEPTADLVFHVKKANGETTAYWVSPKYNFLVRKLVWSPGADVRTEREVFGFQEPEPGVFFPIRVEGVFVDKDVRTPHRAVTYSEVVVNKPHPPGTFDLKFPRGALLFNEPRNQTYDTDENGKPLGKVRTLPDAPLMPRSPPEQGDEPLTETKEEPESWTRYILYISLGILAAAAMIWTLRRRSNPAT